MILTLDQYKNAPSSEKTVVAHLEPSQRLMVFTVHSGNVYKKTVGEYVVNVHQDGTELTEASTLGGVDAAGKWFFDDTDKTLYLWSTGDADPKDVFTLVTYRLFLSNSPVDLPYNLTTGGRVVPYQPLIQDTSDFGASLDSERKGTALESASSLTLYNNDGEFDIKYDRFYWEGKTATIYAIHRNLDLSEKYKLFDGVITGKQFDPFTVSFEISDFLFKLRELTPIPRYTSSDFASGEQNTALLPENSTDGVYKKRIYGRVNGVLLPTAQALEDGTITATGTFAGTSGGSTITGTGSDIHNELSPGDTVRVIGSTNIESIGIDTLSRVPMEASTEMTINLDWDAGTSDLDIQGVSANIDTSELAVGMHIVLKGQNMSEENKGIWEIKSIPTSQIVTVERDGTFGDGADDIPVTINDGEDARDVIAINDSTSTQTIRLAGDLPANPGTFSGSTLGFNPQTPTTTKNRKRFGTHHICQQPSTTVTRVRPEASVIDVDDITGLNSGDIIVINDQEVTIDSITSPANGTLLLTKTEDVDDEISTFLATVSVSDTVTRPCFQRVYHISEEDRGERLRDGRKTRIRNIGYTITNTTSGAFITLDNDAEQDVARTLLLTNTVQWYNGARVVYSAAGEFAGFKSRDFIKPTGDSTWYEIEEVVDNQVAILRAQYAGTSGYKTTHVKYTYYVTDSSKVIADLYGITKDDTATGELVKTSSDVVKHLLEEAGETAKLNTDSFDTASIDNDMLVSLQQPLPGEAEPGILRDVINLLNESVYGSLYNNENYEIEYKILTGGRNKATTLVLKDEDVLSWSVQSDSSRIVKTVVGNYRHREFDYTSEESSQSSRVSYTNPLIENNLTTQRTREVDLYLFNQSEAEIMTQRYAHINRTAQSLIIIDTKLQTIDVPLNDVIEVRFDRLFSRFGSPSVDRTRIGVVNDIKKTPTGVQLSIDDLGNIFNANYTIAAADADDFSSSTATDKRYDGFITDNDGIIDDDDDIFGAQVIS